LAIEPTIGSLAGTQLLVDEARDEFKLLLWEGIALLLVVAEESGDSWVLRVLHFRHQVFLAKLWYAQLGFAQTVGYLSNEPTGFSCTSTFGVVAKTNPVANLEAGHG
jgi:hypothetical protein